MEAKQALEQYAQQLDPMLADFFSQAEVEAKTISNDAYTAAKFLGEYTLRRAKRIRPALIYYTYKMLGGTNLEEARKASMFIEIIHGYLLIHDDIMDQDNVRRGGPTMHKVYEELHKQKYNGMKDSAHFGVSIAIDIGDIANHLAMEMFAKCDFEPKNLVRAIARVNRQLAVTGYGQMHDILTTIKQDVKEEDVFLVHKYKTAVYTFETPISVGALLAGATDADVDVLSAYAIPAGIAFQLQDDILGMFGNEEKLGKPTISDLREGKQTLLILKAMENGSKEDTKTITQALGNPNVSEATADVVRKIIVDTGSLEYSKQTALKFVNQAKKALAEIPTWNGEGRAFLDGLADYMIKREI